MSHYKPYPRYKPTEVEWAPEIPAHWDVKRLRFVASLNPLPAWKDIEGQVADCPFLPMEAFGETGELDTTRRKPIDECRAGYTYFAEGDVAYAKVTPCFENGKGAVMRGLEGGHGFGTTELTVLRPVSIDRNYLYALTFAESFRQPGAAEMLGTGGLKRVPDEFARNYRVALPPREEQAVIAASIDRETSRIDALIAKKTSFIELLQEKRQALITHAVTKGLDPNVKMKDSGVEWIGEVPEHWAVKSIGYVIDAIGDVDHFMPMSVENGVPYLMTGDLKELASTVNWSDCKQVSGADYANLSRKIKTSQGDVVVARYATIGTSMYVDIDFEFLVSYSCVTVKTTASEVSGFYMFLYMKSDAFRQGVRDQINSNTQDNVGINDLRKVKIALPNLQEQSKIAEYLVGKLKTIDSLTEKTARSVNLLKERRSAFITAAVTGQIDLREAA